MLFPQQFPELTIPTGAGPGTMRITINKNQNGAILVYGPGGVLSASMAGAAGVDESGTPYQAGETVYGTGTSINLLGNDGTWSASDGSVVTVEAGSLNGATILFKPPILGTNSWTEGTIGTSLSGTRPALALTSPWNDANPATAFFTMEGGSGTTPNAIITASAEFIFLQGRVSMDNVLVGRTTITPTTAGVPEKLTINYGPLPGTVFRGFTNPEIGAVTNVETHITNVTSTSADLYLTRNSTTATLIDYMIWGV